jgi:hypothetical protein
MPLLYIVGAPLQVLILEPRVHGIERIRLPLQEILPVLVADKIDALALGLGVVDACRYAVFPVDAIVAFEARVVPFHAEQLGFAG